MYHFLWLILHGAEVKIPCCHILYPVTVCIWIAAVSEFHQWQKECGFVIQGSIPAMTRIRTWVFAATSRSTNHYTIMANLSAGTIGNFSKADHLSKQTSTARPSGTSQRQLYLKVTIIASYMTKPSSNLMASREMTSCLIFQLKYAIRSFWFLFRHPQVSVAQPISTFS